MDLSRLVASSSGIEPSMMQGPVKQPGGYMAGITLSAKSAFAHPKRAC